MGYADLDKDANGYLANIEDWNEEIAQEIANEEQLGELSQKHWDLINLLRDEYINNGGNQPNERNMVKALAKVWGEKPSTKDLYALFPMQPAKQGTKVAGLPNTKRKGGY